MAKFEQDNVYILCAAIWYNDLCSHENQPTNINLGYVLCGFRHDNIVKFSNIFLKIKTTRKNIQGFLTSDNRFVNRKEAGKIAFKAGQIKKETDCLFSEDLY